MPDKRIALVTGGIGGIGSAICEALLKDGYHVIANYYPALETEAQEWLEQHKAEGHNNVHVVPGDVASYESCVEMAEKIRADIGDVDTLINCAGITRDASFKKMTPEAWNDVISINLSGLYNVTKQFMESMATNGFGRIVNISSVNGQKGQFGQTNYSSSKAGMHGFTMALAQELARKNVTVNTVSPGYIETEMTVGKMDEEVLKHIVGQVPMGRMGKPEEIGYVVASLCDERASYVTGANIPVNGCLYTS